MEHTTPPANYDASEKSSRPSRKSKSQSSVKKAAKSKKTSQSDPEHNYDVRIFSKDLVLNLTSFFTADTYLYALLSLLLKTYFRF